MFKKLFRLKDRYKMTQLGRSIANRKYKVIQNNSKNNYEILRSWTSETEIQGCRVSYYTLSSHLRDLFEENEYIIRGSKIYRHLKIEDRPDLGGDADEIYLKVAKNKYDQICNRLSNELNSLPNFEGECYRYSELKDSDVYGKKIQVNDFIMDKSFVATSRYRGAGGWNSWGFNKWGLGKYPEMKPTGYFIIKSKTGKYIDGISASNNEHEIIFDKKVVFKVLHIDNYFDRTFYIYLEETCTVLDISIVKDIYTGNFSS